MLSKAGRSPIQFGGGCSKGTPEEANSEIAGGLSRGTGEGVAGVVWGRTGATDAGVGGEVLGGVVRIKPKGWVPQKRRGQDLKNVGESFPRALSHRGRLAHEG